MLTKIHESVLIRDVLIEIQSHQKEKVMTDIRVVSPSSVSAIKVLDTQLGRLDLSLLSTDDAIMTDLLARVNTGTMLVEGQIVMVKAYTAANSLGSIPAIVMNTTRVSGTVFKYTMALIMGDLTSYIVTTIDLADTQIAAIINVTVPQVVVDDIVNGKLGRIDSRTVLLDLNVPSLMTLDVVNNSFNIVM